MTKTEEIQLLNEAAALQDIESNPLTDDERTMFEMFVDKGWSPDQCRAYILGTIKQETEQPLAAE